MRSSRKRQTRLTFDPLPLSSPAPMDLSQSVRDRAATVRYDGASPAKRRKVRDAPGASSLGAGLSFEAPSNKESLPPTPDPTAPKASLGASVVSDDSDDEPLPTKRLSSRKNQKKQKTLNLTPISPPSINSARPVRAGFFGTQQQPTLDSSDSEDSMPEITALAAKNKKGRRAKKSKTRKSPSPLPPPEPEQESQEEPEEEPAEVPKTAPEVIDVDHSDEDQMPTTPAATRRTLKRKRQADSSSPLDIPDEESDDSDVVITGSRKRSLSAKKRASEPESESDQQSSDEEPPSRSRNKRLRRGKTNQMSTIAEEEKQELEDDLLDLASSGSDTEVRLRQRNKSSQKSVRELALEQLKRRRGGTQATVEEEESVDDNEEEEQQHDDEADYEQGPEDEEDDEDELPEPRTTRKQMFSKDEDDEGFVIEDDEEPLGAPTGVTDGIPLAFTRYASMKAKDLFKFAIEWMVQKKINPAFQMNDEIYTLTFQKLDDEVRGLAGSKFTSAAWTSKFTLALQARPDMLAIHIDRRGELFMRDKCDACNRSGHPATYEVKFEGKPYHRETLEPVAPAKDSDSESDESDSESSSDDGAGVAYNFDAQGRRILPEETTFYLGKFCMANAETAHSLQHWRLHLYEWVVEYLKSAGWLSDDMILRRDKWSTRKRRKHANKIVDRMAEEGKIKALYQDYRREIDTARNAKQGRWDSSP